MEVKASLRRLQMGPRKVRLIVDVIRGMKAVEAERKLPFLNKGAVRPVLKLLQSAMANAEHNFKLDRANLFIKSITVDGGSVLKRTMPRAMGSATVIRKRSSHVNIVLSDEPRPAKKLKKPSTKKVVATS